MFASTFLVFAALCLAADPLRIEARSVDSYERSSEVVHKRFARQIVPGTKWCGNGDKATNDEDLGYFRKTDECCREHDKCPFNIAGRETKYGLTNPDRSTRSHCDCDQRFFECLTNASSRMSRTIGEIYFNFLSKKCFRQKKCPAGKTCKEEYEWVEGTTWLPTNAELKKMYQMIATLNPELEFEPSVEDILGTSFSYNSTHR